MDLYQILIKIILNIKMEFFQKIIIDIGGLSIIVTGAAWVLRRIIDNFFSNKIEKFKHDLERENTKFKITYEKLHLERAEIIKETYKNIVLTHNSFHSYLNIFQPAGGKTEDEKRLESGNYYNEFFNFYDKNRIFFEESLALKIDKIRDKFLEAWREFELSKAVSKNDNQRDPDIWVKAWNKVNDDIPPLRKDIEIEFRKLIGIDSK